MPQEAPQPFSTVTPGQSPAPKRKLWKFAVAFLAIVLIAFIAFAAIAIFNQWRGAKRVEKVAEYLKNLDKRLYEEQLADTIGGKTPEETLRLYVEAIEKGDYVLASKYFIHENQQEELDSYKGVSEADIKNYAKDVKEAISHTVEDGHYTEDRKYFSIYEPFLIRMALYPSGVWKIIEI